jgi:hypothetical protein
MRRDGDNLNIKQNDGKDKRKELLKLKGLMAAATLFINFVFFIHS